MKSKNPKSLHRKPKTLNPKTPKIPETLKPSVPMKPLTPGPSFPESRARGAMAYGPSQAWAPKLVMEIGFRDWGLGLGLGV